MSETSPPKKSGPRLMLPLLAIAMFAGAFVVMQQVIKPTAQQKVVTSGKALIGGSFELLDPKGKTVTDKDFRGKYMLVYFGFTYCPDICPTELNVISEAMDAIGPLARELKALFISVDFERDTPQMLGEYVANFHKNIVGLTGDDQQIKQVAKAYRVYYAKVKDPKAGLDADYTIDHSSLTYLMDRNGEYVAHFNYGAGPDEMAAKLKQIIGSRAGS